MIKAGVYLHRLQKTGKVKKKTILATQHKTILSNLK